MTHKRTSITGVDTLRTVAKSLTFFIKIYLTLLDTLKINNNSFKVFFAFFEL